MLPPEPMIQEEMCIMKISHILAHDAIPDNGSPDDVNARKGDLGKNIYNENKPYSSAEAVPDNVTPVDVGARTDDMGRNKFGPNHTYPDFTI